MQTLCVCSLQKSNIYSLGSDHCAYFRFDEFDEAIDEAIEDDIKEADGGGMCLSVIHFT